MSGLLGFCKPSISASNRSAIGESFPSAASTFFSPPSALLFAALNPRRGQACDRRRTWIISRGFDPVTPSQASNTMATEVQEQVEVEVAEGCTLTEFCDKIIDLFLNEKPRVKDWRKYLVFREEWRKYRESFYRRCHSRANSEGDPVMSQKLISLCRKVKKIDDEMEIHDGLLKEIQDNPMDVNAVVARRRKDCTGEFFKYLTTLSETYDSLEDRDACEKIKSLAKAKQLDSSLILLINSAWASAKESETMKPEVKDIMYRIYMATKSSLRSITPKEIKLLKYLLNITDPEERFSALATAFSPGDEREAKDPNALYTTPKELHKWIKIMLDAYHLNKEDTDIREAKQMTQPVVIERLFILKETIEEEYLERSQFQTPEAEGSKKSELL